MRTTYLMVGPTFNGENKIVSREIFIKQKIVHKKRGPIFLSKMLKILIKLNNAECSYILFPFVFKWSLANHCPEQMNKIFHLSYTHFPP